MTQLKNPSQYSTKKNYHENNYWRKYTLLHAMWTNLHKCSFSVATSYCSSRKLRTKLLKNKTDKKLSYSRWSFLKILKIIVMFKLYKNMTIFANCHIFMKNFIFTKYDNKKKKQLPHLSPPTRGWRHFLTTPNRNLQKYYTF